MTILQSLVALYDRLERRGRVEAKARQHRFELVPRFGFKPIEVDFVLEISLDGKPLELRRKIPPDENRGPKFMMPGAAYNPKPKKGEADWEDLSFSGRTSGRRSYIFWDKSSYVFGVTAKKVKGEKGTAVQPEVNEKSRLDHEAFIAAHAILLADTAIPEFSALRKFLGSWKAEDWQHHDFPSDALDRNIAFMVQGSGQRIDEISEAQELVTRIVASPTKLQHCLISGETASFALKHPQFKGVTGAQSSGAAIVSFNADAFESYDRTKGASAPVSEDAAFKYGAALNWLLDRNNSRSFRLGETTVVFWADEKVSNVGEESAAIAEEVFWGEFGIPFDKSKAPDESDDEDHELTDGDESEGDDSGAELSRPGDKDADAEYGATIGAAMQNVKTLRAPPDLSKLNPATRVHILGLSPNSGRIAVRFWLVDTYGHLEENLKRHKRDIAILPAGPNPDRKAYALLYEIAVLRKAENIPPRLGGELARAILAGTPYPRTLYAGVIGRIRADKEINPARAGLCKAVINRDHDEEVIPVSLNPESDDGAYNLGRLFATYEYAERSVADRNATIRDKFIGSASATPRRVFPILMRGYEHNASALAKGEGNQRGSGIKVARTVSQILERFGEMPFPTSLTLEQQGRFFVGYYHQMAALYTKSDRKGPDANTADAEGDA